MADPRVFTSFDFDHDEDLREMFVGQSRNSRTPFTLTDWSVKAPMTGDWKEKVRSRIRSVDQVVVLCGEHMDTATGVSVEVRIAREEGKPVHFIKGRPDKVCKLPKAALPGDRMIPWTWPNLRIVLAVPTPKEQSSMALPQQPRVRSAPLAPRMRTPHIRTR